MIDEEAGRKRQTKEPDKSSAPKRKKQVDHEDHVQQLVNKLKK